MRKPIQEMPFNQISPLYVNKVTRKGRTQAELDAVLTWLTGYSAAQLAASTLSLSDFFAQATMATTANQITGVICGVRVETIEDPLLQKIRQMDKVVDELAKGKAVAKIERKTM